MAFAIIQEPSGFVVGGNDAYMGGGSYWDWLGCFDTALNLTAQTNLPGGCETVSALAAGIDGGYVAATRNMDWLAADCACVVKINAALGFEWQAADAPLGAGCDRDHYVAIQLVADGYVALGNHACGSATSIVLTRFAADGSISWSRTNLQGTGAGLVYAPDGGWLVVGTSPTRRLDDVSRLWLLKTDGAGPPVWEMSLGDERGSTGAAGAVAADGNHLVAGTIVAADGTNRVWVVKVKAGQQAPVAAFTFSTANPVFRNQTVTFDASASAAPGGAIASYEWDFGDGTTATGMVVQHPYGELGTTAVTLMVVNTNSVLRSTSQQVVVVGLEMQSERYYGDGHGDRQNDIGYSLAALGGTGAEETVFVA